MTPVRTSRSNFVYRGPTPDIGDAWVERAPHESAVYLDWQPTDEERRAIADGALVRLGIYGQEPIPPVSLEPSQWQVISAEAARLRDRAMAELRRVSPQGPNHIPPGYFAVSPQVWRELNATGALDGDLGTVPLLLGRPLMEIVDGEGPDVFEYTPS